MRRCYHVIDTGYRQVSAPTRSIEFIFKPENYNVDGHLKMFYYQTCPI